VAKLRARGFENATLYDPIGVGGLHMMYVVPRGEMLDQYGLPDDPTVTAPTSFPPLMSTLRKVGTIGGWAGILATIVYFLKTGSRFPPPEPVAVAKAYEIEGKDD
jgi:hypothetical protein